MFLLFFSCLSLLPSRRGRYVPPKLRSVWTVRGHNTGDSSLQVLLLISRFLIHIIVTALHFFFLCCSNTWDFAPAFGAEGWVSSVSWSGTVGRTPLTCDQLVARPLPVHKHKKYTRTQTLNIHALSEIRTHGPSFRASEGVHALDHSASVTGTALHLLVQILRNWQSVEN
jgi:hypothetical protein